MIKNCENMCEGWKKHWYSENCDSGLDTEVEGTYWTDTNYCGYCGAKLVDEKDAIRNELIKILNIIDYEIKQPASIGLAGTGALQGMSFRRQNYSIVVDKLLEKYTITRKEK